MDHHATRADHTARTDGHATAHHGIGADPYIFFQRDGSRGADALASLFGIQRMAGTGQNNSRRKKSARSDVYG